MRRILIIVAGVIVVLGIAIGIYFLIFSKGAATLSVGNPFGNTGSGTVTPGGDLPSTDEVVSSAGVDIAPRLVKVTDGPIALGMSAIDVQLPGVPTTDTAVNASSTASTTLAKPPTIPDVEGRFIDRASGNVYAYTAHARTLVRISNKTLPGVQRASWTADGTRAYAQFLSSADGSEHVGTYALDATGGSGYLLEQDLVQASVAGSSTLFTLFSGTTGSVGTIAQADGSKSRTLFSSLLSSIIVHPTSGNLYAATKAASEVGGYGFSINRTSGAFTRILGPLQGLSLLPSPSGSEVIYSYISGGVYHLAVLDIASHSATALPVATLSEKCAWAANGLSAYCGVPTGLSGNLPDDWYQGATSFTDRIWKIDLTGRVATLVVDPSQIGAISVDAVALSVDPAEDMLFFTDKRSGALYAYDL
ncbi:MAG: hypothetical protein V4480_01675 [Patescibacteria group bacterium]